MKIVILSLSMLFATQAFAEDTIPTKQAKKTGIVSCLPAVEKISNFLADGNHGANSTWHKDRPNDSAFTSVIERTYNDGSILSSMTVARTKSDQCYTEYERVFYSSDNCIATIQKNYKSAEYKGQVNSNISHLVDGTVEIYLMNAGSGCVVLRKEIFMDLK